jgi:hypothetical protein
MEHLRIDSPCPMLLSRMKHRDGKGHFCRSCSKLVVDYRNYSTEELKATFTPGTCGIFNPDQLPGQQSMPIKRQVLFYGLTLLSFIGFNVKPLNAQHVVPADSLQVKMTAMAEKSDKKKAQKEESVRKKKKLFTRRKKKHLSGCPVF